jgi:VanZ family protein
MRRATAAVLAGLTLLVLWAALDMATAAPRQQGVAPAPGLVVILGGDGLVPALLAALALALTAALRLRARRAGRGAAVGFLLASVAAGGAAFALGMCHAPAVSLVAVAALAAGVPLIAFAVGWPRRRRVAPGLAVWVAAALLAGVLAGPGDGPAASADAAVRTLVSGLGGARGALGIGAGALSARATLGLPGRPSVPGDDVDTDGFLVVRAELGWLGLALVLAASVALAALMVRRWRQGGGPWTRLAMAGGLGMLAANLAHFRTDAAALLAPNLLALAVAMGVVVGWAGEGARWRPARAARLGASRWPLVFGAVILIGSLALAESEMIQGGSSLPDLGDKVLHFGTFAMVALLLCYALGPRPSRSWLRTRVLAAVAAASLLGVAVEFGQRFLTDDRSFERADMLANTLGALSVGIVWWIIRRGQTPEEPA